MNAVIEAVWETDWRVHAVVLSTLPQLLFVLISIIQSISIIKNILFTTNALLLVVYLQLFSYLLVPLFVFTIHLCFFNFK